MHDYFDILGLPTNAAASEIRRACARRARRSHPDFREASAPPASSAPTAPKDSPSFDVAIDFLDMTVLVDRMQAAFFHSPAVTADC